MSLRRDKIENTQDLHDGWMGRCPACAEVGGDSGSNHLRVWEDGKFSCVANQGDSGSEHRKRIWALAGTGRRVARPRIPSPEEIQGMALKKAIAQAVKDGVMARDEARKFEWNWRSESSPIPHGRTANWRAFLSLWNPSERLWVGGLKDSEKTWGTAPELLREHPDLPPSGADLTRALVWPAWATCRKMALQPSKKWLVLEADYGSKEEQMRIAGFVRSNLGLTLRAVVDSTGKSLHAWFDAPAIPSMSLQLISAFLVGLGADRQALEAGATRLPGGIRQPVLSNPSKPWGSPQTIAWINPTSTNS